MWARTTVEGVSKCFCNKHYKKITYDCEKARKAAAASTNAGLPGGAAADMDDVDDEEERVQNRCFNCTVDITGVQQGVKLPVYERKSVDDPRRICRWCLAFRDQLGRWWNPAETCCEPHCTAQRPLKWTSGRKFTTETQAHFPRRGMFCSACKQKYFKRPGLLHDLCECGFSYRYWKRFKKADDDRSNKGEKVVPTKRKMAREATDAEGGADKRRHEAVKQLRKAEKNASTSVASTSATATTTSGTSTMSVSSTSTAVDSLASRAFAPKVAGRDQRSGAGKKKKRKEMERFD
ncbi:hypothetical protein JCM3770_006157 [Rhodotorula araucariae]